MNAVAQVLVWKPSHAFQQKREQHDLMRFREFRESVAEGGGVLRSVILRHLHPGEQNNHPTLFGKGNHRTQIALHALHAEAA